MNSKYNLQLIDGKFSPNEAGNVLFGLISYKINYHQKELFSNKERFGQDLSNSEKRIEELKTVHRSLKQIIDLSSEQGQPMKINCVIEIQF